jgi:drug/metabolite transporter (DMT)-like permease
MTYAAVLLQKPSTSLIAAALAAVYLVWGSTYLAIRFALVSLPPFFQMGSRFIVAGALLMLFSAAQRGKSAAVAQK